MCDPQCMCLPGPIGTFCGFVNRDGIVQPCDPGCCKPRCDGPPPSMVGEYLPTRGVQLPPGFGDFLQTSDRATEFKYESPFEPVGPTKEPPYHRRFFWLVFLVCVMVLMSIFLI